MNDHTPTPPSRPFRRWTGRLAFLYLLITVGVVVWFWMAADEHWIATLLLFGPRWLALTPLVLLLPLALLTRSWAGLLWCAIAAVVITGPFMGGVVNVTPALEAARRDGTMRLMTFNADNKDCDRKQFHAFLDEFKPDVICMQDADRIGELDLPAEYRLLPASNGLRFASKFPARLVGDLSDVKIGPARGAAKFRVNFPFGDHEIASVHLPTPRPGLEAILARKPNAVETLKGIIRQRDQASPIVKHWLGDCALVAGDFNLPVESTIYRRDWGSYRNAFSETGFGWGWTMFTGRAAVRIDQILFAPPWQCQSVLVGPDLGSAHRPVLADFAP
jgi:endonuclease/exonuclease/phosphatase (EEP) superfamily protein YafD